MSERVQFEEDEMPTSRYDQTGFSTRSGFARLLVKAGFVGNERQPHILSGIIAAALVIFAVFYFKQALAEPQIIELRIK